MITRAFFKHKRVTVFGLGLNGGGVATVKFLLQAGVSEVIVTDKKTKNDLSRSLDLLREFDRITYVLGHHRKEDFTRTDMVIINPGISWENEYVQAALQSKIPVEMDASLFFQLCLRPIIGVTGTKGKTTTASLIAEILETAGREVVRVGIGQVPVLDALTTVTESSVIVFELSSWRLSSLGRIQKSPNIAVITNIFPDHLNYYKTMTDYVFDKSHIFAFQKKRDWLIVNKDNDTAVTLSQDAPSQRVFFSEHDTESDVFIENDRIVYGQNGAKKDIATLSEIVMQGEHNRSNVLAAIAATLAFGVEPIFIRKAINNFSGVEHRLEFVLEKNGIRYYNDTAATVPQATVMALRSFSEPIVLIVGGSNKGLDFSELGRAITNRVKDIVFFKGEATEAIMRSYGNHKVNESSSRAFSIVETMEDAVRVATEKAAPGDVVLLSPGAASFGLFRNEFDRGEQFRFEVERL